MNETGNTTKSIVSQPRVQEVDRALDGKSDELLVTLLQNGERDAFRVLVQRYQGRVKNLIYSILHDADAVDDLAQEVFIKAYEAVPQFRFRSSFFTWLYRIAVNKSRDELRRRKIRRILSLQALLDSGDHELGSRLAVEPRDNETQELITAALRMLPEKFRVAVVLKEIQGLSYEEIADVLQCEVGTVKSRLFRARATLRNILKPYLEERS
jgi:RNA polymerase sigma-70 factor (ECF subfamily)